MGNTNYINDSFIPFMDVTSRYAVLYGGSGSGKSFSAAQKIVTRCVKEIGTKDKPFAHHFVAVRKYRTSIKLSVFKELKAACIAMGLEGLVAFNESYLVLKFWNGAEISCIGLDDPEKVKSIKTTGFWIEEATELEKLDFQEIERRLRGRQPYYKQTIVTFNPINEEHWLNEMFFAKRSDMVYLMHSTYRDNAFIDDEDIRVLEERFKFDENAYRIYVKGEWGRLKTGSEYYFNFKYDKHVNKNVHYISGLPLHISFDFNVNPYISATVSQIYRKELSDRTSFYFVNVIDEFALVNPYNTTERLCEAIISKYKRELSKGCFIYGDASGRARTTRSNISDYDIIEHNFEPYMTNHSMNVPKANPMIKKRRNFINKLLFGGWNIQFQVADKCKKVIDDFQVAVEEQDGSKKKQMAKNKLSHVVYEKSGHHADCNDYFLCAAFERYYDTM